MCWYAVKKLLTYSLLLPQGGTAPQFSVHIYCAQTVADIILSFNSSTLWFMLSSSYTEVDLRPRPRPHCIRRGLSCPLQKGHSSPSPLFWAHAYYGHGRPSQLLLSSCTLKFLSFVSDYLILFLRTHYLTIHHLWHWMAYNVLMC